MNKDNFSENLVNANILNYKTLLRDLNIQNIKIVDVEKSYIKNSILKKDFKVLKEI